MDTFTFELEMTLEEYDLFQWAADVLGLSVEQFVMCVAVSEAYKITREVSVK